LYDELRKLAAHKLIHEKPGQTLQPTALVHEAYLRLLDGTQAQHWNSRGHFFGAAAEAMRRILVEAAHSKAREKRGGDWKRVDFEALERQRAVMRTMRQYTMAQSGATSLAIRDSGSQVTSSLARL
jgi:RNA polymerase sigma factor (TIGR02999 family)